MQRKGINSSHTTMTWNKHQDSLQYLRKVDLDFKIHVFICYTVKCLDIQCNSFEWGEQKAHPGRTEGVGVKEE